MGSKFLILPPAKYWVKDEAPILKTRAATCLRVGTGKCRATVE